MSDLVAFAALGIAFTLGFVGALTRGPLFGRVGAVAAALFAAWGLWANALPFYGVGILFCLLFLALGEGLRHRGGLQKRIDDDEDDDHDEHEEDGA